MSRQVDKLKKVSFSELRVEQKQLENKLKTLLKSPRVTNKHKKAIDRLNDKLQSIDSFLRQKNEKLLKEFAQSIDEQQQFIVSFSPQPIQKNSLYDHRR